MTYEMVIEYIRSAKYRVINSVRVYDEEKIILLDIGDYYILVQAHDNTTWINLLSIARTDPDLIRQFAEYVHNAVNILIPGTISIMYLRKKDVMR